MPWVSGIFEGVSQLPATIIIHITFLLAALLIVVRFFHHNPIVRHNLLLSAFIGVALISFASPVFYWMGGAKLSVSIVWLQQETLDNEVVTREPLSTGEFAPTPESVDTGSVNGGSDVRGLDNNKLSEAAPLQEIREYSDSPPLGLPTDQGKAVSRPPNWLSLNNGALFWVAFLVIWGLGAAVSWLRLYRLSRRLRIIELNATMPDAQEGGKYNDIIHAYFDNLAVAIKILHSDQIQSPITFGVRRPTIIFPKDLVNHYAPEDLSNILVHEAAHILRHDYLINLLQKFIKGLFWFHPLLHLADRQLDKAREEVCDNYVVHFVEPIHYSETLYKVSWLAGDGAYAQGGLGMSNMQWNLEERIRGLLVKNRRRTRRQSVLQATAFLIIFLSAPIALAVIRYEFKPENAPYSPEITDKELTSEIVNVADDAVKVKPIDIASNKVESPLDETANSISVDEEVNFLKPEMGKQVEEAVASNKVEDSGVLGSSEKELSAEETQPTANMDNELQLSLLPSYSEVKVRSLETTTKTPTAAQFAQAYSEREFERNLTPWQPVQLLLSIPKYPMRALKWEREGYCIVEFTINEHGSVEDASANLCSPEGVFERVSEKAVNEYRFIPKIEDNKAVGVPGLRVKLTYRLQDKPSEKGNDFDRDGSYRVSPDGINSETIARDGYTGSILTPRGIEPDSSRISRRLAKALTYQSEKKLSRLQNTLQKLEDHIEAMNSLERYTYYFLTAKAAEMEGNSGLANTYYAKLLDIDQLPSQYQDFANLRLAINKKATIGETVNR